MDDIRDFINLAQTILTMNGFRIWLESVATWLESTFPNSGYLAEWLALDPGPPEGDRAGNSMLFKKQLEEAVDDRIRWLNKLEKVKRPLIGATRQPSLFESSDILLGGLRLFKAESALRADEAITTWIESVQAWLMENQVEAESLADWTSIGKSPFRMSDGVLDTARAWEAYWGIVCKRYRWLADFISNSSTIENQYRRLSEIDDSDSRVKINFEGPGYELMAMLKEALQKEGGFTKFRLFADDDSIYEYAAFKFLVRGKEVTVKQLRKSVENKQYL